MAGLFDYYRSITTDKVVVDFDDDDIVDKFPSFLINRFLSQNRGDVLLANEINSRPHMHNRLQIDFFINTLRKKYRKAEKFKYDTPKDIELIMEFYNYNQSRAREVRHLFDEEALNRLRLLLDKGGTNGEFDK